MKNVIDDVLPSLKKYKMYLKTKYNKDNLCDDDNNQEEEEEGNSLNNKLKKPISKLLENINTFLYEYLHSYYKNLKFIIKCIENLLEQRMVNYFEEHEERIIKFGKAKTLLWWNEKEKLEKSALYDTIKTNWMEETKPLSIFYAELFDFIHICL